ncbi:MAG TPA: TadE family protein [Paraburkholderia sp.]
MNRRLFSRQKMRGVAAVEFGLVLIPLMLLVTGVTEFGYAIYQYDALTKATRDAARYLSEFSPSDIAYPVTQAQCLAVYGTTDCSGSVLVTGLKTSMVVICDRVNSTGCPGMTFGSVPTYDSNNGASSGTAAGSINLVAVKITGYSYAPIEPFRGLGSISFNDITTVMRQVL